MTTEAPVKFEFRCSQCFHTQYTTTDMESSQVTCTHCHQMTDVPTSTPDRIKRAESVSDAKIAPQPGAAPAKKPGQEWTDADFEREVKKQFGVDTTQINNMDGFTSSRLKRFGGHILDGVFLMIAYMLGFGVFFVLLAMEVIPIDVFAEDGMATMRDKMIAMLAIYLVPTAWCIIQWNMIATEGKSLAKKILKMRIIRVDGGNPGFFQGVLLRNWLRVLLSFIPFFGMLDAMVIFGDSKRCIHDFMAGTYVIDEL